MINKAIVCAQINNLPDRPQYNESSLHSSGKSVGHIEQHCCLG